MQTKVLIAIDLSENSSKAVDYVGRMLCCHPSVDITLLSVIKEPSPDIHSNPQERQEQVEQTRVRTLTWMEQAARGLVAQGIPENRIHLKIHICRKPVSIADLILGEQQNGGYGTIVVGRQGLSKREEFLFGSVSSSVVREARHCAVWVVE